MKNKWPIIDVTRRSVEETVAKVVLYPNPTTDELFILNGVQNSILEFYSQEGLKVKEVEVNGEFDSISTEELNSGVFVVLIKHNGEYKSVHKIVKN